MNLELLSIQMFILLIIILVGYLCGKARLLTNELQTQLSSLVLQVGIPAMILASVSEGENLSFSSLLLYLGSFFAFNLLMGIVSYLTVYITREKQDKNLYQFMYMFSNIGFMGLPVVNATLGAQATLYAALFLLPSNLMLFTYGEYLMKEEHTFSLKNLLTMPVIASLMAIVLCVANVHLPYAFEQAFTYLGNITTPLAMLIIGSSLVDLPQMNVKNALNMLVFVFLKLLVLPLGYWLILYCLGVPKLIQTVLVLLSAMPVASNVVIYANIYKKNTVLASQASVITSIACVATIPLVFGLISLF